jgi:hypothetical protein
VAGEGGNGESWIVGRGWGYGIVGRGWGYGIVGRGSWIVILVNRDVEVLRSGARTSRLPDRKGHACLGSHATRSRIVRLTRATPFADMIRPLGAQDESLREQLSPRQCRRRIQIPGRQICPTRAHALRWYNPPPWGSGPSQITAVANRHAADMQIPGRQICPTRAHALRWYNLPPWGSGPSQITVIANRHAGDMQNPGRQPGTHPPIFPPAEPQGGDLYQRRA